MIMSIRVRRRYRPKIPRTCTKCAKQKKHHYTSRDQVTSMMSRTRETIRLRFSHTIARRRSIGVHYQLQRRLHRTPQAGRPESKRNKGTRKHYSQRHNQMVLGGRHQTGARHDDSRSVSHPRRSDSNPVSSTPRPTSERPLPQRRRYWVYDHKQEHHLVLVTERVRKNSPA